jgi:hypothetical protein
MKVPVTAVVYRVALTPERAVQLRERVSAVQAAGEIEVESCFTPLADAKVLRVEPDEPGGARGRQLAVRRARVVRQ